MYYHYNNLTITLTALIAIITQPNIENCIETRLVIFLNIHNLYSPVKDKAVFGLWTWKGKSSPRCSASASPPIPTSVTVYTLLLSIHFICTSIISTFLLIRGNPEIIIPSFSVFHI